MLQAWTFSSSFVVFVMRSLKTSIGCLSPRASMMSKIACVLLFRLLFGRPLGLAATPG